MLVIRRHAGQSIWIGDDVQIEIMACAGNRVKLGIRAPQEVAVVREEARETRQQNLAAARSMSGRALVGLLDRLRGSGALRR